MELRPLNENEQQLFNCLMHWFMEHDSSPSIHEIARKTDIPVSTLRRRLDALEEKGYIKREEGRRKTIRIPPEARQPNPPENLTSDDPGIPVIDTIAAGTLGQPFGDIVDSLDLSYLSNQPDYFAIRVVGDSMIGDNIVEGDFAIMRRVKRLAVNIGIQEGEIVAARVEDEGTTLKRFYREGKKIRLEASNYKYDPILIAEDRVQIQGVLVGIWREAPRPSRRGIR